ncbi:glycine N-acyltransferase-like protein 3-like [Platysternon megacephalum]|uniref:Glycine N-acyltransferase-like protein 3-like n=1 Tax=Platysternon megacephalum TaxID=55544 RepID=A0A4D9DMM8_9SAUR|nr:glycine N-acyltransferase-like protein 3-like [Platysternon megacephalum]
MLLAGVLGGGPTEDRFLKALSMQQFPPSLLPHMYPQIPGTLTSYSFLFAPCVSLGLRSCSDKGQRKAILPQPISLVLRHRNGALVILNPAHCLFSRETDAFWSQIKLGEKSPNLVQHPGPHFSCPTEDHGSSSL